MKFRQDSSQAVDCNCSLFAINQQTGLVKKNLPDSRPKVTQQSLRTKEKISLRRSSLQEDSHGFNSRRQTVVETQSIICHKPSQSNHPITKKNELTSPDTSSRKPLKPIAVNFQIKVGEQESLEKMKTFNSSLSPHFKNPAACYKSSKLNAETTRLSKKNSIRHITFNNEQFSNSKLTNQKSESKPYSIKLTEKQHKCSLTTMAASNNCIALNIKNQRFSREDGLTSFSIKEEFTDRTSRQKYAARQRLPNSQTFADLLYRQAQSMIGDGENIDDPQFSYVVNTPKKLEGLNLLNNYKKANPFLKELAFDSDQS